MIGITPRSSAIPAGATRPEDEAAARATSGYSIAEAVRTLLDGFDTDHDGGIFHQKTFLGMRLGSELHTSTSETTYSIGALVGRSDLRFVKVVTHTDWTIERLFRRADVNHDDYATNREIAAVVTSFDTDGDGRLSTLEFQRLRAELGAERGWSWRDVIDLDRRRDTRR